VIHSRDRARSSRLRARATHRTAVADSLVSTRVFRSQPMSHELAVGKDRRAVLHYCEPRAVDPSRSDDSFLQASRSRFRRTPVFERQFRLLTANPRCQHANDRCGGHPIWRYFKAKRTPCPQRSADVRFGVHGPRGEGKKKKKNRAGRRVVGECEGCFVTNHRGDSPSPWRRTVQICGQTVNVSF